MAVASNARPATTSRVAASVAAKGPLHWIGRLFQFATFLGLSAFGVYIVLRATGHTPRNFGQWKQLVSGAPISSLSDWIANLGIGLHFAMGAILVLAWPILLSARIRASHPKVHRWTGRVYVSAGLLAGVGGLSSILTHGSYSRASSIAFGTWGAVMMLCAAMAYVHARARRMAQHRAWAIRLFAMVLGSWIFDLEIRAWTDLTGGLGVGAGDSVGPFDLAILWLFFLPNLLVAEFFIRHRHRSPSMARWRWPAAAGLAALALVFAYSILATTALPTGKFGRHLLGQSTDA